MGVYLTGTTGPTFGSRTKPRSLAVDDLKAWQPLACLEHRARRDLAAAMDKKKAKMRDVRPRVFGSGDPLFQEYVLDRVLPARLGLDFEKHVRQAEGPYASAIFPDEPLTKGSTLRCSSMTTARFTSPGGGWFAPMRSDMSGLAEEAVLVHPDPPDVDPAHHDESHCTDKTHVGFEGAFLFKANGRTTCRVRTGTQDGTAASSAARPS